MTETRWAFIHPFQLRLQRGIEVYLWNLASALAKQGIRVDILTWAGLLDVPDYARISGIKLYQVPSVRYFQAQFAVPYYVYWLLKNNYHHVFVHFAGYGEGPALRLARLVHTISFSVIFHFPPSLVPHRYREFARWNFQQDAAHLIAVSHATAHEVEKWASRPCKVIPHGVDAKRFRPDPALRVQTRRKLNLEPEWPVLISVAALEERKGIKWVIQALPEVLQICPNCHYLVVGDGPYRGVLEKQVDKLGLHRQVLFLGFQKDIIPYLCAADVGLLLSWGEASPISLLEFAAVGLPVLTSYHPPFPELVRTDWGRMVDESDSEEVVREIVALLMDSSLREHMGHKAREWVTYYCTWPQAAARYQETVG